LREILTIIAACIVVALAAALAAPPFIDWNSHSAAIAQKLGDGFGGRVALEGPVRLRLLPAPRLTAGVLVAERSGLVVRAKDAALELSAPALLRGAFEFTEIALTGAEVAIDPARLQVADRDVSRVAVSAFRLTDATLSIAGNSPFSLAHVDMTGAADSLIGPFRGQGAWRAAGEVAFTFSTGKIEQGRLRGKFTFDDPAMKRHGEATGDLALAAGAPEFSGQAILAGALGQASARASFALKANAETLHAEKIDARLGDEDHALNFSGEADFSHAKGLDAQLAAASLDLDRFRSAYPAAEIAQVAPPFPLRARLAADSATLGGEALTNLTLDMSRKDGATPSIALDAGLPGRTRLHYDGALASLHALDGALKIETRDPGKLAGWLAPAAPQAARWLAAATAARLAYDGRVKADADGIALDARALEFDRSRLAGAIDWRAQTPAGRGKLTAQLRAPLIDIDSLPDFRALGSVSAQDDLDVALEADALRVARVGEAPAETGKLKLALLRDDGATTLKELLVRDLGGANLSAAGRITAQGGGFDFRLDAEKLADLAALIRRVAPGPASEAIAARAHALSPARLTLGVATDASGAFTQVNLAGEAGGARYSLQGQPSGNARMQARLSVQAAEASTLLRQAGLAVLPLKGLGRARLEAQCEGAIGGPLQTRAVLDLAGLALRFDGETILALDRASLRGKLSVETADLSPLAPLFAFGAPDMTSKLPLHGAAQMRFDAQALALDAIEVDVAGTRATGSLTRALSGAISGALKLDRLSAPDLAALALGPPQPASVGALWPALRFAPARFELPIADVALDVARLDLGGDIVGRDARLRLLLAPGSLAARDLDVTLGEGRISGDVSVRRESDTALAQARLSAEKIDVSAPPFTARVSGKLDVSGAGSSMAELVASLAGGGRFSFDDARIAAASPDALAKVVQDSEASESALEPPAISARLAAALDGGAQALPSFESEATIATGRLALTPVQMRVDALSARLSGLFDLRNGALDVRETLTLPQPPGFGSAPRIALSWSGPPTGMRRTVDPDALIATLAERAIVREGERNAALETDIHERAFFNKRLKLDRRNAEERRALEEAKRILMAPPVRAPAPAQTDEHPRPPARPPAAFTPTPRGAAPDPSTAGRY